MSIMLGGGGRARGLFERAQTRLSLWYLFREIQRDDTLFLLENSMETRTLHAKIERFR